MEEADPEKENVQTTKKKKAQEEADENLDPIYKNICKIPQEIKAQVELIAQEMWKEERGNTVLEVSRILGISPTELEAQLQKIPAKRGRPRKKV